MNKNQKKTVLCHHQQLTEPCGWNSGWLPTTKEILRSYVAFTPFYQKTIKYDQQGVGQWPEQNFLPYDLFCLKTKSEALIQRYFNYPVGVQFARLKSEEKVQVTVQIYKDGDLIALSEEQSDQIEKIIQKSYQLFPGWCCLYDLWYEQELPHEWVSTILPFIFIEEEFESIFTADQIYIKMAKESTKYKETYNKVLMRINKILKKSYQSGFLVLDQDLHKNFIEDWEMTKASQGQKNMNLYCCHWSVPELIPNLTAFLLEILSGITTVRLDYSADKVKKLQNLKPTVIKPNIYVQTTKKADLIKTADLIL